MKLENQVSWAELAPSLQHVFKNIQSVVTKLNEDLDLHIKNAKDREKETEDAIKKAIDEFDLDYLGLSGAKGQVIRTDISGGRLYADNNFFELRAITDPIKKEDIWDVDLITLKDVCSTWERRSWGSAFGSDDLDEAKSSWTYDDVNKGISNHGNWNSVGSFGSIKKYDYFWIKMSMNSVEPNFIDDDWIGFIPLYMSEDESPDGQIHTIMVGRVGNADTQWNQYPGNLCLIYDFGKSTQLILDYVPRSVFGNTRWQKGWYTSLYVLRKGGNIQAASSNPQQTRNQSYLMGDGQYINWSLPKTKPSNWPDATWDIICKMMDGPSKIGFWTCSNDCIFYLDDQEHLMRPNDIIVDFNIIYEFDFKTGTYKNGRTLQIEDIPLRSFVYNGLTEQFYWYKQPNEYTEIKPSYIVDPNKTDDPGPFALVDSEYDEHDGYLRYYRVYANGWCEQGGYSAQTADNVSTIPVKSGYNDSSHPRKVVNCVYIPFKIIFKTENYLVSLSKRVDAATDAGNNASIGIIEKFDDKIAVGYDPSTKGIFYHAEGYVDLDNYKNRPMKNNSYNLFDGEWITPFTYSGDVPLSRDAFTQWQEQYPTKGIYKLLFGWDATTLAVLIPKDGTLVFYADNFGDHLYAPDLRLWERGQSVESLNALNKNKIVKVAADSNVYDPYMEIFYGAGYVGNIEFIQYKKAPKKLIVPDEYWGKQDSDLQYAYYLPTMNLDDVSDECKIPVKKGEIYVIWLGTDQRFIRYDYNAVRVSARESSSSYPDSYDRDGIGGINGRYLIIPLPFILFDT